MIASPYFDSSTISKVQNINVFNMFWLRESYRLKKTIFIIQINIYVIFCISFFQNDIYVYAIYLC